MKSRIEPEAAEPLLPRHVGAAIARDLASGRVTEEALFLFLHDPDVVWRNGDPLVAAKHFAFGSHPQIRAQVFSHIAVVTSDPRDLQSVQSVWVTDSLNEDVRAHIGKYLVFALLHFKRDADALEVARQIPSEGEMIDALLAVWETSGDDDVLAQARTAAETLSGPLAVKSWRKIAEKSLMESDIARIPPFIAALEAGRELERFIDSARLRYVGALSCFGRSAEARAAAAQIKTPRFRVLALAKIAERTGQATDLRAMLDERTGMSGTYREIVGFVAACFRCTSLDSARSVAESLAGADAQCVMWSIIARMSRDSGDLSQALRSASRLRPGRGVLRDRALQELATALAQAGKTTEAKSIAGRIQEVGARCRALLAAHLAEMGKLGLLPEENDD